MGGRQRKTTEWFIAKAKSIYGDKFDYSRSIYLASSKNIEIVCSIHGSFWQRSAEHFLGRGCPHCNRRTTLEQFTAKAARLHGGKYDYSLVEYLDSHSKVRIKCKKHGIFEQVASTHTAGKHCPKCTYRVSKPEAVWLDNCGVPKEYRMKSLTMVCGKRFEVDAYDPTTNTVYEFNGDYWHGNPVRFPPEGFNERSKKTFGELYQKTIEKEALLCANGYKVVSIWESDFKKQSQAKSE